MGKTIFTRIEGEFLLKFDIDSNYCKCYNNTMMIELDDYKSTEFSLGELVATAKSILGKIRHSVIDGRVAAIPDARTVRYYQTLGILKKPLRYKGRSAVYGYQHLLQLIAIKLLQREGLTLAQIQNAMIRLSLKDLEQQLQKALLAGDAPSPAPKKRIGPDKLSPISMGKIREPLPSDCDESTRNWIPIYQRIRGHEARDLIAAEILPGISVMIDPHKVTDARGILDKIRNILQKLLGEVE
jgi:DNA-binding transcriptional MerR regulator